VKTQAAAGNSRRRNMSRCCSPNGGAARVHSGRSTAATMNFQPCRKVGARRRARQRGFELWLISDKLPQPRSLGVIGGCRFLPRGPAALASYDANYRQHRDLCGDGRAGVADRPDGRPHSAGRVVYRQADREPCPGALSS